jgi:hypothetical protein
MIDRSNVLKTWYEFGEIVKGESGWVIKNLLVRWNERQETREAEVGPETEYVYDAYRLNYILPVGVQPGQEAVEYYLEQAKTAVIQLAQDLLSQEEGFRDSE